jgi:transcriptional regulator with XRE-family HTH domain
MNDTSCWRDVLATLIKERRAREHLAQQIGVNPVTLARWIQKDSHPRLESLTRLLSAVPAPYADPLRTSIAREFPTLVPSLSLPARKPAGELPASFYRQLFKLLSDYSVPIPYIAITDFVLTELIKLMNAEQEGLFVVVLQCLAPRQPPFVRSLVTTCRAATLNWPRDILQDVAFFGAESLVGYAVSRGHSSVVPDCEHMEPLLPLASIDRLRTVAVYPIRRGGRTAGGLAATSILPHTLTVERQQLLEQAANALNVAFAEQDFYASEYIRLAVMPSYEEQRPLLANFRERVTHLGMQLRRQGQTLYIHEAETRVYQQLERELMSFALAHQVV